MTLDLEAPPSSAAIATGGRAAGPTPPAAAHAGPPGTGPRDAPPSLDAGRPALRPPGLGRARAGRLDARGRAGVGRRRCRGGRPPGRARGRRGHPLRPASDEGRARLRGLGRRRDRPGRVPADPGARAATRDDRRHVPVRVHRPRPLRAAGGRRIGRQRRRARPTRRDGRRPGAGGRRHRGAERDDGRPGRRDPGGPRRRGLRSDRDHGLRLEARLGLLRPVPRGGRQRTRVRRPARLPDGPGQRPRGAARDGRSTSPRAPTSCSSSRPCPGSTSSPPHGRGSTCRSPPTRCRASTR